MAFSPSPPQFPSSSPVVDLVARIGSGVATVDAAQWNALADVGANPFISHDFLALLEQSGSVGPGTGWTPLPLLLSDDDGGGDLVTAPLRGALPAYIKGHSQGEYVFDHHWAQAFEQAGGNYYPKLQLAVPFTPVPGPRLLGQADVAPTLIAAAQAVADQHDLSSVHATFVDAAQIDRFADAGWLIRQDSQFHWHNRDANGVPYADFDAFLASLSARKRKAIRKERIAAQQGVEIHQLTGNAITPANVDAMWLFYQDTGARKWGSPYLTRAAFDLMAERMADRLLMVLAYDGAMPIAGALNIIGDDALFGRYWGCTRYLSVLHFELCYYQAIEFAIARGLSRVEAGAQGGHKLARGYMPVPTWSAHYIRHMGFRRAVAAFLEQERIAMQHEMAWLDEQAPYRKDQPRSG